MFKKIKKIKGKRRSRKSFIKLLDDLWSIAIKIQAGNRCQKCGVQGAFYNSHHWWVGRAGGHATRWSLNNGLCLCVACHFDAEQNSGKFMDELQEKMGREFLALKKNWGLRLMLRNYQKVMML